MYSKFFLLNYVFPSTQARPSDSEHILNNKTYSGSIFFNRGSFSLGQAQSRQTVSEYAQSVDNPCRISGIVKLISPPFY